MNEPTPHEQRGFMPDKLAEFEADLKKMERTLRSSGGPFTARQLVELLQCSKQAVYFRIEALKANGVKVKTAHVREGKHGPKSKAFSIE
jgi:biotin operon repressor